MIDITVYILKIVTGTFLASLLFSMALLFVYDMILIFVFRTWDTEEQSQKKLKIFSKVIGPFSWLLLMIFFFVF